MKKVINGKKYDTETAECVGKWSNGCWGGLDLCAESLYRKRTGEFFLHGDGGARSRYAKQYDNFWYGGQQIIPLSESEAREWAEEHLTGEEYEEIFGVVDEDGSQSTVTISLSTNTMDHGRKTATKLGMSLPALVETLLQNI